MKHVDYYPIMLPRTVPIKPWPYSPIFNCMDVVHKDANGNGDNNEDDNNKKKKKPR
jgi:hypothetical protein